MSYLGLSDLGDAHSPHPLAALRRVGVIADLSVANVVGVNVGGDTTTIVYMPYLQSYTPNFGDQVVLIATLNGDYICLGTTTTTGVSGITGEVRMYAGNGILPTGWLLCDGSAVSRTTYAALFGVTSTTYGVGDGSTTFNLPNLTSRFPRGNTASTGGGADTHSHGPGSLVAQVTVTSGPKVAINRTGVSGWTSNQEAVPTSVNAGGATGIATGANVVGNTDTQNNIPNYTGFRFIIRT